MHPAWSISRGPNVASVAILGFRDPRISSQILKRIEGQLAWNLRSEASLIVIPPERVRKDLEEKIPGILAGEITSALEDYYHLRFDQALRRLSGRTDPEALKVKILIAFSGGDFVEAKSIGLELLRKDPDLDFSRDFPPGLSRWVAELKWGQPGPPQMPPKTLPKTPPKKEELLLEVDVQGWRGRFQRFQGEMQWDFLLVYRVEPIGWNYKITVTRLSLKEILREAPETQAFELIDLRDLHKASKIVVKTMFSIDSPRKYQ